MHTYVLNDGNNIPAVGFGVFEVPADGTTYQAVRRALDAGYRHIDTAAAYNNEAEVGRAIRDSGIPREDIFVTSKLWIQDYGLKKAGLAIRLSLAKLGLDYLDLYLLHQPYFDVQGSWLALEKARDEGLVRSLGVSNFTARLWQEHIPRFATVPCLNQVEFHPFFQQRDLRPLLETGCFARGLVAPGPWHEGAFDASLDLQHGRTLPQGARADYPALRAAGRLRCPAQVHKSRPHGEQSSPVRL